MLAGGLRRDLGKISQRPFVFAALAVASRATTQAGDSIASQVEDAVAPLLERTIRRALGAVADFLNLLLGGQLGGVLVGTQNSRDVLRTSAAALRRGRSSEATGARASARR